MLELSKEKEEIIEKLLNKKKHIKDKEALKAIDKKIAAIKKQSVTK